MNARPPMSVQEKVALAVSSAIVLGAIVYWIVQIVGVMEVLEMAYG